MTPHMNLVQLPLLATDITADPGEDASNWIADHATFSHRSSEEHIFWIPPNDAWKKAKYGEGIPPVMETLLRACSMALEGREGDSYVRIYLAYRDSA